MAIGIHTTTSHGNSIAMSALAHAHLQANGNQIIVCNTGARICSPEDLLGKLGFHSDTPFNHLAALLQNLTLCQEPSAQLVAKRITQSGLDQYISMGSDLVCVSENVVALLESDVAYQAIQMLSTVAC